jgi:hypothetical protein
MATEVQHQSEQSLTSLVGGIVSDFQDLIKQQMKLTRREIEADLRKYKEASSLLAMSMGILLITVFSICLMLGHLFHWLAAPAGADPSALPLWASFALVSGLFGTTGVCMMLAGKKKIESVGNPLHDTEQALKENIEWKTNKSPS